MHGRPNFISRQLRFAPMSSITGSISVTAAALALASAPRPKRPTMWRSRLPRTYKRETGSSSVAATGLCARPARMLDDARVALKKANQAHAGDSRAQPGQYFRSTDCRSQLQGVGALIAGCAARGEQHGTKPGCRTSELGEYPMVALRHVGPGSGMNIRSRQREWLRMSRLPLRPFPRCRRVFQFAHEGLELFQLGPVERRARRRCSVITVSARVSR